MKTKDTRINEFIEITTKRYRKKKKALRRPNMTVNYLSTILKSS